MKTQLGEHEFCLAITNFGLMGVGDFTHPSSKPKGEVANSEFTSDDIIHPHFRFRYLFLCANRRTLTKNIRERRGENVNITIPLYKDEHTPEIIEGSREPGTIYMDSMAFGMGMCCLQMTFQCCNIDEARMFSDRFDAITQTETDPEQTA